MRQLIVRFLVFVALVAAVTLVGWWSWCQLWTQRNPTRTLATRFLEDRLGRMTPEQRRQAGVLVAKDPLAAMLAAESGGWNGLQYLADHGPDEILRIQRLAIDAGLHRQLDGVTAERFTDAAFTQYALLEKLDAQKGSQLLEQLEGLSPDEYANVGFDSSYLLIMPRIETRYREMFRKHQALLTSVLAAAEPNEWNRLLDKFSNALPHVARIYRDSGLLYGMIYMLHSDLVNALTKAGIPEMDALDFVGLNAHLMRQMKVEAAVIAEQVSRLRQEKAADGQTLFTWATRDPAVFWLVVHSQEVGNISGEKNFVTTVIWDSLDTHNPGGIRRSLDPTGFRDAVTVLQRYAGTQLPMVLTKYAQDDECFRAAMESLVRFDNWEDTNQNRRSTAARVLNHYQDNPAFKAELLRHGATLIPALSTGKTGMDVLSAIQRNPSDIGKYVTQDGQPITGKPWWTWIPGGNIVYLVRELTEGRTTEIGDWIWAYSDVIILMPFSRGAIIMRSALKGGGKTGTNIVSRASTAVAREMTAETIGRTTWRETLLLLRSAGVQVGKHAIKIGRQAGEIAIRNPRTATLATVAVLSALYPEQAANLVDGGLEWIAQRLQKAAKVTGKTAAVVPGEIIRGIWEEINKLANSAPPMLAWLFYVLATALTGMIALLPLVILRLLLPDVFHLLQHWAAAILRAVLTPIMSLVQMARSRHSHPR